MKARPSQPLLLIIRAAAFLLPLSLYSQTTINGKDLVHRSSGVLRDPSAWSLNENGFLGTFINLASSGNVTFETIRVRPFKFTFSVILWDLLVSRQHLFQFASLD